MRYVDTSVLVAALTNETETKRMQTWLAAQKAGNLAVSEWVATEFSAALSVKLRTRQIAKTGRSDALAMFAQLLSGSFVLLAISAIEFRAAAHFADQYSAGLRADDALHLAVCANHGATLCTLDRRLSEAGTALGVKTLLL